MVGHDVRGKRPSPSPNISSEVTALELVEVGGQLDRSGLAEGNMI